MSLSSGSLMLKDLAYNNSPSKWTHQPKHNILGAVPLDIYEEI